MANNIIPDRMSSPGGGSGPYEGLDHIDWHRPEGGTPYQSGKKAF